jgi:predicted transcriptional regulator
MIVFACKKIKKEEIIRCSFNINKTEYNIFMFLLKSNNKFDVLQIAEKLDLDRTTVQKAVKRLAELDLVRRYQQNLEKGGYIFFYQINNKKEIKDKLINIITEWYENVKEGINKL